jgi:hypothetical protein
MAVLRISAAEGFFVARSPTSDSSREIVSFSPWVLSVVSLFTYPTPLVREDQ